MTDQPLKKDNRSLAIGLAVAAAACLLYATFTRQWLVNSSRFEEIGFGLRSHYECASLGDTTQCQESTNTELIERFEALDSADVSFSPVFPWMGWATFVECLVAAAGLLGAAGIALSKKTPQLPITPPTIALLGIMATLVTGMVFVAKKPGGVGSVGVGLSFWVFAIGAVTGIAASQLLAKVNRPPDPDLMADAMNPDQF
jgi:hypothetical protein